MGFIFAWEKFRKGGKIAKNANIIPKHKFPRLQ